MCIYTVYMADIRIAACTYGYYTDCICPNRFHKKEMAALMLNHSRFRLVAYVIKAVYNCVYVLCVL